MQSGRLSMGLDKTEYRVKPGNRWRRDRRQAMMETILHILSKDTGEKPAKKANTR
jgi:hypothetical protein